MGVSERRPRTARCAQRAFGVLATLGLLALGSAAPAAATPTDAPAAGSDTGLASTSECKFGGKNIKSTPWSLQRVLLDELRDQATGKGVKVAVIDTGVDSDNPQIGPALLPGDDFVGGTKGTEDENGHGTRVAGIIAAQPVGGTGFSGLAHDAKILPLRYTGGEEEGNSETMSKAIRAAVAADVDVINISSDTADKKPNPGLEAAVAQAVANDILVVVAAGNDGADGKHEKTYPAAYDDVLAVAASDRNNERAQFSQSGDFVDIAAPGVGMVSTVPNGGQCPADGTSFAAPYVAGVAALMVEKYPDWTSSEIAARLMQTADRPGTGPDAELGWGVVDPVAALTGDDSPQQEPVEDKPRERGRVAPMTLTIGESEEERTKRYAVYVIGTATVLTLLVSGAAIATRDRRRKRTAGATADTTTSTRN
ncbi:type VII secretion-associated serine protease mycosin [Streptomyces sp. RKND-216]|uniref:type VII secretion-associated serine protease mycosin n=1 Tax=Streptomyces sp. RKND-216 TaxID=2562581 RepID=UPI001FF7EBFA|nr:type VII secretion-associated serine protease mycosin [Streptomyces sp. RKND-216]